VIAPAVPNYSQQLLHFHYLRNHSCITIIKTDIWIYFLKGYQNTFIYKKSCMFHGCDDVRQNLLGCNATYYVLDEDRGSMVLQTNSILPQHYMASQPIRSWHESSLPWKSRISSWWCKLPGLWKQIDDRYKCLFL